MAAKSLGNFELKITERTIDIEDVFRKKNPGLARLIPKFVFGYLRRVIHETEINSFLYQNREKQGLDFVDAVLDEFGAVVETSGIGNLPVSGRCLIASNHPLGGLDGMALMQVVGRIRRDVVFPVNDLLMFLPNLRELFVPVNKHGSNYEAIGIIEDTFASGKIILFFPAGLVSRKQGRRIEDLEWKKTFLTKAVKHRRPILPVYIEGRNSGFFYRLANLRKSLGIKSNIEMLYLVDEMFRQKNKTIRITFGKPIDWTVFDDRFDHREWARRLRAHVYDLGRGYEGEFDPLKNPKA